MKLAKALVAMGMARSGAEAQRLVKQRAVKIGGCIPPCNMRLPPYECSCNGWSIEINPAKDVPAGVVLRIGSGDYRLLKREGQQGFDVVPGIGWVPADIEGEGTDNDSRNRKDNKAP